MNTNHHPTQFCSKQHYIIIDDDGITNFLNREIIFQADPQATVQSFTSSSEAWGYIQSNTVALSQQETIIFMDINMPQIDGWELIEKIDSLPIETKNHLAIYIVSSSVLPEDIKRAETNPNVKEYIRKPLTKADVQKVISPTSLRYCCC